jgi:hypothetical protein
VVLDTGGVVKRAPVAGDVHFGCRRLSVPGTGDSK